MATQCPPQPRPLAPPAPGTFRKRPSIIYKHKPKLAAGFLPRLDSLTENEFKEQKSSKDELKGGYSSERDGGRVNLAPRDKVPSREAEKGMPGGTPAAGRGPRTNAEG